MLLFSFMDVEKHIADDQWRIVEHQKEAVLASGGIWVDPKERARREQAEAKRREEEERIRELKAKCAKKGLNFEEEEAKFRKSRAKGRTRCI